MPVNPGMLANVSYSAFPFRLSSIIYSLDRPVATAISCPLSGSIRQLDLHWGDHYLGPSSHRQRKDRYLPE